MVEFVRHSPSSLNLFCASPAFFVLEKLLGRRQPAGAVMHRGVAVEAGVLAGLNEPDRDPDECVEIAKKVFDANARPGAFGMVDEKAAKCRADIDRMVLRGLQELRPYGPPTSTQGFVEWRPEGLRYPIVGYYDFRWDETQITVDLKTSAQLPSAIKIPHARQVALYTAGNATGRLAYVTPTKSAVYQLENARAHRDALHKIALACERFLALSSDPQELVALTMPDLDSYHWGSREARQLAWQHWGI